MEARDIFGDEPDDDELSEAPSIGELATTTVTKESLLPVGLIQGLDDASQPQRKFLTDLLVKKNISAAWVAEIEERLDQSSALPLSKAQAHFYIDKLIQQPDSGNEYAFVKPTLEELPAGRYAILNEQNEIRFYQVWRGVKYDKPDLIKVYIQHGPDDSELPFRSAMVICKRIISDGPLVCAQRYGREIGSCYRCGRRLTNRISRHLGIGPICGNRDFGSEFKDLENKAREEIKSKGYDPEEVIEIDSEQK